MSQSQLVLHFHWPAANRAVICICGWPACLCRRCHFLHELTQYQHACSEHRESEVRNSHLQRIRHGGGQCLRVLIDCIMDVSDVGVQCLELLADRCSHLCRHRQLHCLRHWEWQSLGQQSVLGLQMLHGCICFLAVASVSAGLAHRRGLSKHSTAVAQQECQAQLCAPTGRGIKTRQRLTLGWLCPRCATLLTQSRYSSPALLYRWQPSPRTMCRGFWPMA